MIDSLTQLVPWPVRIAARKAGRALRDAHTKRTVPRVSPLFRGQALAWSLEGQTLEVELFRTPCNEIGTTALAELELLAAHIRRGAGGARAILFYSSVDRGFCAGADLRELYTGLVEQRRAGASRRAMGKEVRSFLDRIHRVF